MGAKDLALNIAVNLGRMARWATEGKRRRIEQFLIETEDYVEQLEKAPQSSRFHKTFKLFQQKFRFLAQDIRLDEVWAEEALTWANILTHRAQLA